MIMNIHIRSKYLKEFINEIQYKNRNPQDLKALELLEDISTNPERNLEVGTVLYRSRIILKKDKDNINKIEGFYGFSAEESFVPPINSTQDLRANYRYIPYLYCSNHPYTAIVEVRPRLGTLVSVATIEVIENIRLLDFTMHKIPKKIKEAKKNLFADLSSLYSYPVTADDDILDYIPTQFIAEYAKRLGYDGISFKSSLTPEINATKSDKYNVVVFNYQKCKVIKSNKVEITTNTIEYRQTDTDSELLNIYYKWVN